MIVSNSSPLIALSRIDKLNILKNLYNEIAIPEAVSKEVSSDTTKKIELTKLPWIKIKSLKQPLGAKILSGNLGRGESEAIVLALELSAELVILDESSARNVATLLNLKFTGTLGILLKAKKHHLISSVKENVDNLIRHEFRLSQELYHNILELAGEQ